jgi:uncharacterized protein HemX
MESETTNTIPTENKGGVGGIAGAIIIVAIIIIGGWYFIGNRVEKIQDQKEATTSSLQITTGTSTEIQDIQTDLDNLNLKVLD